MHQLHLNNHYFMILVICTNFNIVYNICFPFFIVTQVIISHGTATITDDDEGDMFEDDEKEDEGYLFARQGICTKCRIPF
jgi:hypothetical protein